jgi:DNA-binding response OmpR family regulator
MHVLLIEDNLQLAQTVTRYLANEDIACTLRMNGAEGYSEAVNNQYDVVVLDINLPGMDGIEVCRRLRLEGKAVPIIMLTSRGTRDDIVTGLDFGADDYLPKPCDYRELVARIRALGRRNSLQKGTETIEIGRLKIDLQNHSASLDGKPVELSKREFELLLYFARNAGNTISKQDLAERVWGIYDAFADQKIVEVYIGYLRKKIPNCIVTKKGYGYALDTEGLGYVTQN